LLDAYCPTWQGDGWHTAPDDGYLCDHLVYHLEQSANLDSAAESELRNLFADQSWLNARVTQTGYQYEGYLADLALAWDHIHIEADHQVDANQELAALA
jgi:hypothetical protein